jgi:hypothetical protein
MKYGLMTEVINGGIGSSVRRGNLTVREKIEGDHKLIPLRTFLLIKNEFKVFLAHGKSTWHTIS